jgi:hypothetical protein
VASKTGRSSSSMATFGSATGRKAESLASSRLKGLEGWGANELTRTLRLDDNLLLGIERNKERLAVLYRLLSTDRGREGIGGAVCRDVVAGCFGEVGEVGEVGDRDLVFSSRWRCQGSTCRESCQSSSAPPSSTTCGDWDWPPADVRGELGYRIPHIPVRFR